MMLNGTRGAAVSLALLLIAACTALPEPPPDPPPAPEPAPEPVLAPQTTAVPPRLPDEVYSAKRELLVPVDRALLEGRPGAELWTTRDGGATWTPAFRFPPTADRVAYAAPADGRYGFRVVALDSNDAPVDPPVPGRAPHHIAVVDGSVPHAVALGPVASNRSDFAIRYEVRNMGPAPLESVTVYVRAEGEREWTAAGQDADQRSPVPISAPDGRYGIYLACISKVGAQTGAVQPAPGPSTAPQIVTTVDTVAPVLAMAPLERTVVRAGSVMKIGWTVRDDHPDPRGLAILHSRDDGQTWSAIAQGVNPAQGGHSWLVPPSAGATHRLRIDVRDVAGNRASVVSGKRFTIDADVPRVALLDQPKGDRRDARVAIRFRASDATSPIRNVSFYARPMKEGVPYVRLAGIDNAEGVLEADLPAEGRWGVKVIATDAAGHASAELSTDLPPDFVAGFDRTPPVVSLEKHTHPGGVVSYLSLHGELKWAALDAVALEEEVDLRVEYSTDGGATWALVTDTHPNTGATRLTRYLKPGRDYRVRLTAVDRAGNEAAAVSAPFDPGDAPTTPLSLHGIEEARAYIAGTLLTVSWRSEDVGMHDVRLDRSEDGGQTWTAFASIPSAGIAVALPRKRGGQRFRLVGTDTLGRPARSQEVGIELLSPESQLRIATDLTVEAGGRATVLVEPAHVLADARLPELQTFDGKAWNKVADVTGPMTHFVAPGAKGDYRLRLSFTDADGRTFTSNEALFQVVPPVAAGRSIQLKNFLGDKTYRGGSGQVILIRTGADIPKVEVSLSADSGAEGSWRPVPADHLRPVKGGVHWSPLPQATGSRYRIRVSGRDGRGTVHRDESPADFAIDATPPTAVVTGPVEAAPGAVTLRTRLTPSISPIREVLFYVSPDGGRTWAQQAAYPPDLPAVLRFVRAGTYGLYAVAKSTADLAGEAPKPGTPPQLVLTVTGADAPEERSVTLTGTIPKTLRGGSTLVVEWMSKAAEPAALDLLTAEGTVAIAKDLPASHAYAWVVPKRDLASCRLRVTIGSASTLSAPFAVDASAPDIDGVGIEPVDD